MPETPLSCAAGSRQIDATPWLITEVTHELTDAAYTCRIELEIRNTDQAAPY
jgi:uncharacterized protein